MRRHSLSISHLLLLAVTAGLLLGGPRAFAQTAVTAHIPFAFTANHQTMPAGSYKLELLSDRFLCFTDNRTGRHQAVIMVQPVSGDYIESRGRLRFLARANRHYLMEIHFSGSSMHSMPVLSRSFERELAGNKAPDLNVEIAMK